MIKNNNLWDSFDRERTVFEIRDAANLSAFWFDEAVKNQLFKLETKGKEFAEHIESLEKKLSGKEDDQGRPCDTDINIYNEMGSYNYDVYANEEQRYAICEMLFVNLFKSIELALKRQIASAYPNANLKDLYKWELLAEYLSSKNIILGQMPGYQIVNEIRLINNNIKHTVEISAAVLKQNIPEFSSLQYFNFSSLTNYYQRIKAIPNEFMQAVGEAIINDLYEFNNDRISKIAKDLKSRMSDVNLIKLISKLQ